MVGQTAPGAETSNCPHLLMLLLIGITEYAVFVVEAMGAIVVELNGAIVDFALAGEGVSLIPDTEVVVMMPGATSNDGDC